MLAANALEATARRDVVRLDAAALGAHGLAFRLRPTKLAERLMRETRTDKDWEELSRGCLRRS